MAEKTFNTRIKHKKDTEANWTANNPVLLDGEFAIVVTEGGENKIKIGDGTTAYNSLPFSSSNANWESLEGRPENLVLSTGDLLGTDVQNEYLKYTAQTLTTAQKEQARTNIGASVAPTKAEISISTWTNKTANVSVSGVTADSIVIVTAHPSYVKEWSSCVIRATSLGSGSITFTCDTQPSSTVRANVLIMG